MELWAVGFNAYGQLNFDNPVPEFTFWRDLRQWTLLLEDEAIEILHTSTSATIVKTKSAGIRVAGQIDEFAQHVISEDLDFKRIAMAGNGMIARVYIPISQATAHVDDTDLTPQNGASILC